MTFVMSETAKDYEKAVGSIKNRGYTICGLIIDGKQREVRTHALTTGNCAIKLPMKFFFPTFVAVLHLTLECAQMGYKLIFNLCI